MTRDKILREKDRVQKKLWKEAGETSSGYVILVHERAKAIKSAKSKKAVSV